MDLKTFTKTAGAMLAVTLFSALLAVGCSDDDNGVNSGDNNGDNNGSNNADSSYINRFGEFWGSDCGNGYCDGIAFFRDGSVYDYMRISGRWYQLLLGTYSKSTYTTSGNTITITSNDHSNTRILTYSVSGNVGHNDTLRLTYTDDEYTETTLYTRRSISGTSIITDEDVCEFFQDMCELVLPEGRAWVDDYPVGNRDGLIFRADGSALAIDDYSGSWAVVGTGWWSAYKNNISFNVYGYTQRGTYRVTGNTLILEDGFMRIVFTNTAVTISGGLSKQRETTVGHNENVKRSSPLSRLREATSTQ